MLRHLSVFGWPLTFPENTKTASLSTKPSSTRIHTIIWHGTISDFLIPSTGNTIKPLKHLNIHLSSTHLLNWVTWSVQKSVSRKVKKKALEIYIDANNRFGPECDFMVNIASCYLQLDKIAEAKMTLLKSLRIEAHNEEIYFLLGEAYAKSGAGTVPSMPTSKPSTSMTVAKSFPFFGKSVCAGRRLQQSNHQLPQSNKVCMEDSLYWREYACFVIRLGLYDEALKYWTKQTSMLLAPICFIAAPSLCFSWKEERRPGNTYQKPSKRISKCTASSLNSPWTGGEQRHQLHDSLLSKRIWRLLIIFAKHYSILIDGGDFITSFLSKSDCYVCNANWVQMKTFLYFLGAALILGGLAYYLKNYTGINPPIKNPVAKEVSSLPLDKLKLLLVLKFLYLPPTLQVHDLCASAPITLFCGLQRSGQSLRLYAMKTVTL